MCTFMLFRETLPAEKVTLAESQHAVDQLMQYERKLVDERQRGAAEQPSLSGVLHKWPGEGETGIYVWLTREKCGFFRKKSFYYVRKRRSMWQCGTTAYEPPMLIVQKSKLRPDQVEYMERKCRETLAGSKHSEKTIDEE